MRIILLWTHRYPDNIEGTGLGATMTILGSLCSNQTIGLNKQIHHKLWYLYCPVFSDNVSYFNL